MDSTVVLNGPLRLKKGSTWRGQHDLKDLSLVKHNTDSKSYGLHSVSFTVESVIPLHTVKLYSLTRQRYLAFTKSLILSDFLSQVFRPMSIFQQPKYALLIRIHNSGLVSGNPFDENEVVYPLAKESYILLVGRRSGEQLQGTLSLQVFAQLIRDRLDYPNFYSLSNTHGLTMTPSLTAFGENNDDGNGEINSHSNQHDVAESILQSYLPDLLSTTQNRHMNSIHPYHPPSWQSLSEKDMDRIKQLDQLRDESRRRRPERTLPVIKRKQSSRKNTNPGPPPPSLPSTLKKSASASALSLPSATLKRQPSLPNQSTKSSIPSAAASSSASQQQQPDTESSYHDANKKQLKSAVWSKLLQEGHDKKAEDTKQLFHCIYQSMQYALRKSFKDDPLDQQLVDSLIDSHIQFYSSLDLPNDIF